MTTPSPSTLPVLVDSHVHLYSCFDPQVFLDAATRNFGQAARSFGFNDDWMGFLLFTEVQGLPTFDQLLAESIGSSKTGWQIESTKEPHSVTAKLNGDVRMTLVRGRQVVTRESIEVLALVCSEEIPDGKSAQQTLEVCRAAAGISVLPWGFGKWSLRRGELVERLLSTYPAGSFYLGDTSSRATFLPEPRHFKLAEERGFRILQGTDPLPFAHEVQKPGSCGFLVQAPFDLDHPAGSLLQSLESPEIEINSYRRADSMLPFLRNQFAMQIRKRLARGPK